MMATTAPALSVVIPAFNAAATLGEQLDALSRQEPPVPVEIVVVDNASTDETARIIRERASADGRIRLWGPGSAS